jgi:hypothetical protein
VKKEEYIWFSGGDLVSSVSGYSMLMNVKSTMLHDFYEHKCPFLKRYLALVKKEKKKKRKFVLMFGVND